MCKINKITCATLIIQDNKVLMCHSTGNSHWDLPKGLIDDNETTIEAAKRELLEETGFNVDIPELKFMFQCKYSKEKDIALFLYSGKQFFDVKKAQCNSFFKNYYGKELPEVDDFCFFDINEAIEKTSKSMKTILMNIKDKLCSLEQQ
jgi:predicted NUDIX family NTP pyrophosphohydrolase